MTQIEFTTRTNVEVSASEFDAINEVYMNCDLDKDEFCKMWRKMNATRVAKALAEQKAKEQAEKDAERAYRIYNKLSKINDYSTLSENVLTESEQKFLAGYGIEMMEQKWYYPTKTFCYATDTRFAIGSKFGFIR